MPSGTRIYSCPRCGRPMALLNVERFLGGMRVSCGECRESSTVAEWSVRVLRNVESRKP